MSSGVSKDLERLHFGFVEAVYSLHDGGQITEAQRDKYLELLECIDEFEREEFEQAWAAATKEATA